MLAGLWAAPRADAHGRSGDLGVKGMSERKLRTFERGVLGPAHAREHARGRRAIRRLKRHRRRCRVRRRALRRSLRRLRRIGTPVARRKARRLRRRWRRSSCARRRRKSSRARLAAAGPPEVVGAWGAPFPIPILGIHAALLPTGKVMWFSYPNGDKSENTAQAWLWNPANGQSSRVDPPLWRDPEDGELKPANIWCAGQAFLADGRLLVVGGNLAYSPPGGGSDFKGLNKVYTFNPWNETWTEQPDLRKGRWYPTVSLRSDGSALILAGLDETGIEGANKNPDVELFEPSPDLNGRGSVRLLGTLGGAGQPPIGGTYPHMFQMPSGGTLVAGPEEQDTYSLSPSTNHTSFSWANRPDLSRARYWGTAVLLPGSPSGSTAVQLMGGQVNRTVPVDGSGVIFDEAQSSSGWQAAQPFNVGRAHHNTVQLPDESMVTLGGGVGWRAPEGQWAADPEHRQVELWEPNSGTWWTGPSQQELRAYHSTALLLPDGRVISAGDDYNGGQATDTAEIYSPPYLFRGARPRITSAPSTVSYNQSFTVQTPNADVVKAVLVAPGATTHAADMSQRTVELALVPKLGLPRGFELRSPPNAHVAPPSHYMLFLVNSRGVPSLAKFIRLMP